MSTGKSTQRAERIIGLFPELLGTGGVQEAGRLTASALHNIAGERGWATDFLGLNDPIGTQVLSCDLGDLSFRGFERAKAAFVMEGLRQARVNGRLVLAAHPNLAVPAAFMQRIVSGIRTIVMAHGIEVWKPLSALRRGALLSADIVLAPSRDTVRKLIEVQGVPPERVRLLPWPLSPDFLRMAAAPEVLPLPAGFPPGRIILTVGRWVASEKYKGADDLIRAVAALRTSVPDVCAVAVGTGDDLSRLRQLSKDLGVVDRVHFLGRLSSEELAACYARADVFALPSTGEGFGLVFLEAMAFAKPVVGVSSGGATDLIEDGANGFLVPAQDGAGLAQALEKLLCDDSAREEMGQRGAKMIRDRYQFGVFRSALAEILTDCMLESSAA